jgi:hypothetical protein
VETFIFSWSFALQNLCGNLCNFWLDFRIQRRLNIRGLTSPMRTDPEEVSSSAQILVAYVFPAMTRQFGTTGATSP